jgi:Family of unknown function (DUF6519)
MKGDFTRDTFDKTKNFSRVLMQQGRVQLDADWNEQTAILLHYLRTLATDIIGPHAGPANCCGFNIIKPDELTAQQQQRLTNAGVQLARGDFLIGVGRYYVDGLLCENHQITTYLTQGDLRQPVKAALSRVGSYLAYLDVWERHVTSVEDDYIREKALGGPDTATRAKVVWQLRVTDKTPRRIDLPPKLSCVGVDQMWRDWVQQWQPANRGHLTARVEPSPASTDPCNIAPEAKYRGAENQLYRVEIHRGGAAWGANPQGEDTTRATFKWSRDNGSISTALLGVEGDTLVVQNARGFAANGWVEIIDDERELHGQSGVLTRLVNIEGDKLTIDPETRSDTNTELGSLTKVRSWDQRASGDVKLVGGVMRVEEGVWIPLEDGIEVFFAEPNNTAGRATYRAGDYWLIPARVATGDIEWPTVEISTGDDEFESQPKSLPPHGVQHHYAPIGVVEYNGTTYNFTDCRCEFAPINDCNPYPYGCGDYGIGFENMAITARATRTEPA